MTLLSICQDAAGRIGLGTIDSIVANTNPLAVRLRGLATASGRAMMRRHAWQFLRDEVTFTTTATEEQTNSPIPTDFHRFVNETLWNRSLRRPLMGPMTPQEYQEYKASATSVLSDAFVLRQNKFYMLAAPGAGQTVAYEYVSKYWCKVDDASARSKTSFTADTDVPAFDEELMTLDLVWRYKSSVGLPYAEAMNDFEIAVNSDIANDGGKRTLNFTQSSLRNPRRGPLIQEGDWTL